MLFSAHGRVFIKIFALPLIAMVTMMMPKPSLIGSSK